MIINREELMSELCGLMNWEHDWFMQAGHPARIDMLKDDLNTKASVIEADIVNLDKRYRELLADKALDNNVRIQVMNEKNEKSHRLEDINRILEDTNKIAISIREELCQNPLYKSNSARQREITDLLWKA